MKEIVEQGCELTNQQEGGHLDHALSRLSHTQAQIYEMLSQLEGNIRLIGPLPPREVSSEGKAAIKESDFLSRLGIILGYEEDFLNRLEYINGSLKELL